MNKLWNIAVNRLYYACFYAVSALLADIDIYNKTHSGIRQMFGLHYIKTGKISTSSGIVFNELFDKRQKGDYEDYFVVNEQEVMRMVEPVNCLLIEVKNLLEHRLNYLN